MAEAIEGLYIFISNTYVFLVVLVLI